MKNKYQRMTKEEKKKTKEKYYATEEGKNLHNRLIRLLITGIMGILFSGYLVYSNYTQDGNNIWQYIMAAILFIASIIFIIGSSKIKGKVLNKYAIKNSK